MKRSDDANQPFLYSLLNIKKKSYDTFLYFHPCFKQNHRRDKIVSSRKISSTAFIIPFETKVISDIQLLRTNTQPVQTFFANSTRSLHFFFSFSSHFPAWNFILCNSDRVQTIARDLDPLADYTRTNLKLYQVSQLNRPSWTFLF